MRPLVLLLSAAITVSAVDLAHVESKAPGNSLRLPGELMSYQSVDLRARVNGYVERVLVDRGSFVQKGQLLVEITAPEMQAQIAEAESRAQGAESQRAEAQARLAGAQSTYNRLKAASATAGAIAGNELVQAEKSVEASEAAVRAATGSVRAARAAVESVRRLESYLNVSAPFAGVVTDRYVHPGALAGPNAAGALMRLEQNSRLRLVVAVPESEASAIPRGARLTFTVSAYPNKIFNGVVARVSHSMDPKTRTMPVELDVANPKLELAPGMFPEVSWPTGGHASLLVPATSVVTTTERTFVIRDNAGHAEWVDVRKGKPAGDQVEVVGALRPGDAVVRRATDEIRPGTLLR